MVELTNKTPFAAHYLLLPDTRGVDTLFINVAARFKMGPQWTLCDEQSEPRTEDSYWGEPGESSLRHPLDTHTGKSATDIAIHGSAWAPDAKPVTQLTVSAQVGNARKHLSIFGSRIWEGGTISRPQPFTSQPLHYEHAYGGPGYPFNPVGKGYRGEDEQAPDGLALPAIEDPQQRIQSPSDRPTPAGFGFIAPHWRPRADHAGTYDIRWQETRAPYPPSDYHPRFLNAAHPDWIYGGYLQGGEPVELINLHPSGPLRFHLPALKLAARIGFKQRPAETPAFYLETVTIDTDNETVQMHWKAGTPCNNAFSRLQEVTVSLQR